MAGDFVDLIAWQQASRLSGLVHELANELRGPGAEHVADQLRRAAESIPANIAEGHGRRTPKDFARFLRIAGSSAGEVENHLRQSVINKRIDAKRAEPAILLARRVRALIRGLENAVLARGQRRKPDQRST